MMFPPQRPVFEARRGLRGDLGPIHELQHVLGELSHLAVDEAARCAVQDREGVTLGVGATLCDLGAAREERLEEGVV